MRHVLIPIAAAVASLASQAQTAIPAQRLSELRHAIQQSQANPGATGATGGSRQLTAEERAELRRQVQEQSRRRAKP